MQLRLFSLVPKVVAEVPLKRCRKCRIGKPKSEFYQHGGHVWVGLRSYCRACATNMHRAWSRKNRDKLTIGQRRRALTAEHKQMRRAHQLEKLYGISISEFNTILETQNGRCAICGSTTPGKNDWAVDHDHVTGLNRGILCHPCNLGLGSFKDNPTVLKNASHYLEKYHRVVS